MTGRGREKTSRVIACLPGRGALSNVVARGLAAVTSSNDWSGWPFRDARKARGRSVISKCDY